MKRKKTSSKRVNKRLDRKSFRAAERAALSGIRSRSLRTMSHHTPASIRTDKLPLDGG